MSVVYIMNLIITHSLEEKLKLNKFKNVVKPSRMKETFQDENELIFQICSTMIIFSIFLFSENVVQESQVLVNTSVTSVDRLISEMPSATETFHEGWQKAWDNMYLPNLKWLKSDGPHGIFEEPQRYVSGKGTRTVLKNKMEFHPPPLPTSLKGTLPSMSLFFSTHIFFRPVGVMGTKIPCSNSNCPASSSKAAFLPCNTFVKRGEAVLNCSKEVAKFNLQGSKSTVFFLFSPAG